MQMTLPILTVTFFPAWTAYRRRHFGYSGGNQHKMADLVPGRVELNLDQSKLTGS